MDDPKNPFLKAVAEETKSLQLYVDELLAEIERLQAENRTLKNLGITQLGKIEQLEREVELMQHDLQYGDDR